jgi:hypothetical protein
VNENNINAQNNYKCADDIRSDAYVYSSGTSSSTPPPQPANIPLWKESSQKKSPPFLSVPTTLSGFPNFPTPESRQQESAQLK